MLGLAFAAFPSFHCLLIALILLLFLFGLTGIKSSWVGEKTHFHVQQLPETQTDIYTIYIYIYTNVYLLELEFFVLPLDFPIQVGPPISTAFLLFQLH